MNGAFGSLDGLNLTARESSNPVVENATYNGWLHSHCYSCVIAFSPKGWPYTAVIRGFVLTPMILLGLIIACNLNAPGSWHDSRVARPIYEKLQDDTPDGYYLIADTAFPRGMNDPASKIKAPIKSGQRLPADPMERAEFVAFDRQLLSYRQTAEWGMRALQGSFGRLRVPLDPNDPEWRCDLLELCVRMNNVRASLVGINQIRNVYLPTWREAEDARLWFEFEDMLLSDVRAGDRVSRFHLNLV